MTTVVPSTKQQIKSALLRAGLQKIDKDALSKCVAVASTLHLSPEVMAEVWEVHSLNKQNLTELTVHHFEAYKNELIKASSSSSSSSLKAAYLSVGKSDLEAATTPQSETVLSRKPNIKRENPPSNLVTPLSSAKRHQKSHPGGNSDNKSSGFASVTSSGASTEIVMSSPSPSTAANNDDSKERSKECSLHSLAKLPKYEDRKMVGRVVASYRPNKNSETLATGLWSRGRYILSTNNDEKSGEHLTRFNIIKPYRHMFTTTEDRSTALEKDLVQKKDFIMKDMMNMNENEKKPFVGIIEEVNFPRQDLSTFVGRICNEAHHGKLNSASVVLEGSNETWGGTRVNVEMIKLQQLNNVPSTGIGATENNLSPLGYSLFPGQIVAINGVNGTGRKITAKEVKEGAPEPTAASTIQHVKKCYYSGGNDQPRPVKVITACGPFTSSRDLKYEPLIDLLNIVVEEEPDVVILSGPFVDIRQNAVQSGRLLLDSEEGEEIIASYEMFFADKITAMIEEALPECHADFIIIPSLDDATAKSVYPQPPFQDRLACGGKILSIPGADNLPLFGSLGLDSSAKLKRDGNPRIRCLSNPCTFQINEIIFGVTSTDVLFHMSIEETNANLPPGSRLRRIASHLVNQRSYYPLFPPNKSISVDLKQQDGWKMPCKPDVLILPSKLAAFCSPILGSTMVLNPGHLTKGTTGGTYAIMEIHPVPLAKINEFDDKKKAVIPHDVQERIKIDVKRI